MIMTKMHKSKIIKNKERNENKSSIELWWWNNDGDDNDDNDAFVDEEVRRCHIIA